MHTNTLISTLFGILFIFNHADGAENNSYHVKRGPKGHYQRIVQAPRDTPKNRALYRPSADQGKGNESTESFRSLEENNEYFKKTVPRVDREPSEESEETYEEENQPRFSPSRPSRYLLRPPTSSQRKSLQQNRSNEETSHASRRWLLQPRASTTRRFLFRQRQGNSELVTNSQVEEVGEERYTISH